MEENKKEEEAKDKAQDNNFVKVIKNKIKEVGSDKQKEEIVLTLNNILEEKSKVNKFIAEKNFAEAEKGYKAILDKIETILKNENVGNKNEIVEQKKFIMSNLAFSLKKQNKIKEGMEYDSKVVDELDKKFLKSYVRLIDGYLSEDNIPKAKEYLDLMKSNVDSEELKKITEVVADLEKKVNKE